MDNLDDLIPLTAEQRIARAIESLPTLTSDVVPLEDSCPICLVPFSSILDGSAQNEGMLRDVTPKPIQLSGVTKLHGCGHVFCRVDLIEWIRGRHGTCPACRDTFLDIKPITDSDNESSDGDYIPGEDDEDEDDDGFLDADGFTDVDEFDDLAEPSVVDGLEELVDLEDDIEVDAELDIWGERDDDMDNLGLSDGYGSESFSEGDLMVSGDEAFEADDNAHVFTGDEPEDTSSQPPSGSKS